MAGGQINRVRASSYRVCLTWLSYHHHSWWRKAILTAGKGVWGLQLFYLIVGKTKVMKYLSSDSWVTTYAEKRRCFLVLRWIHLGQQIYYVIAGESEGLRSWIFAFAMCNKSTFIFSLIRNSSNVLVFSNEAHFFSLCPCFSGRLTTPV